jgi:hypothetical protein
LPETSISASSSPNNQSKAFQKNIQIQKILNKPVQISVKIICTGFKDNNCIEVKNEIRPLDE